MSNNNGIFEADFTLDGFHGEIDLPVRGRNLRAWNSEYVAIDMDPADVRKMEKEAWNGCGMSDCSCGGYSALEHMTGATYLIPVSWLEEMDDDDLIPIIEACIAAR